MPNSLVKMHINLYPFGSIAILPPDGRPNTALNMFISSKLVNFPANFPMASQDIVSFFLDGNTNRYPFDVYTSTVSLTAFQTSNNTRTRVAVNLVGAIQGFTVEFSTIEVQKDGLLNLDASVRIARSTTTIFFSLFIVIGMWLLSMTAFTLAFTLWFRQRKVEPPTIGLVASLLFALPAIRNTQPGVPGIGCTIDVSGFLWNMFLVLVASLLLMWNYILKYTKDKPHRSDVEHLENGSKESRESNVTHTGKENPTHALSKNGIWESAGV